MARPEGMKEDLYLFTTLDEPAEEVTIETDLRSIKNRFGCTPLRLSRRRWSPANC